LRLSEIKIDLFERYLEEVIKLPIGLMDDLIIKSEKIIDDNYGKGQPTPDYMLLLATQFEEAWFSIIQQYELRLNKLEICIDNDRKAIECHGVYYRKSNSLEFYILKNYFLRIIIGSDKSVIFRDFKYDILPLLMHEIIHDEQENRASANNHSSVLSKQENEEREIAAYALQFVNSDMPNNKYTRDDIKNAMIGSNFYTKWIGPNFVNTDQREKLFLKHVYVYLEQQDKLENKE